MLRTKSRAPPRRRWAGSRTGLLLQLLVGCVTWASCLPSLSRDISPIKCESTWRGPGELLLLTSILHPLGLAPLAFRNSVGQAS